jgi:methyl-accepting chemotaxis protein
MKNLPIVFKFLSIMALFGVFAIGVAVYSTSQMRHIDDSYSALMAGNAAASTYVARAGRNFETAHAAEADAQIATEPGDISEIQGQMNEASHGFTDFMEKAAAAAPSHAAALSAIEANGLDVINNQCGKAWQLGNAANSDALTLAAQQEYLKNCRNKFTPVIETLKDQMKQLADETAQADDGLTSVTNNTIMITYTSIIGGLALVLGIGFAGIRAWVVGPINALMATMARLSGGDYQTKVDGLDRKDEVGGMSRAVQMFKEAGLEKIRLEGETAQARQAAEAERKRAEVTREALAKEQAQVVTGLATGLEKLSSGDLLFRLSTPFSADYEKLRTDFNAAMEKLQQTMRAIASNTQGVRSGAAEITEASDDLSRRTEQQAASLEQTAAALGQITATVKQTAEGANEARNLVSSAKTDAERSGQVVRTTVEAMSGIENSSKQISNIIGVIDEIAFQTNLLALNAGVEAARAGDAGRGFAVVATEVRALAQRSADAAKEIKTLISASSQQVETGVKLVGETGKALGRIVEQVAKLNALVTDIAASAQEQSTGLAEVNTAVNQMDQVTQQNAAMVEESTAASHSLNGEATELARLIGQFQIGQVEAPVAKAHSRKAAAPGKKSRIPVDAPMPERRAPAVAGGDSWDEF